MIRDGDRVNRDRHQRDHKFIAWAVHPQNQNPNMQTFETGTIAMEFSDPRDSSVLRACRVSAVGPSQRHSQAWHTHYTGFCMDAQNDLLKVFGNKQLCLHVDVARASWYQGPQNVSVELTVPDVVLNGPLQWVAAARHRSVMSRPDIQLVEVLHEHKQMVRLSS